MLATTSWESMFETLCEYVASKVRMNRIAILGSFTVLTHWYVEHLCIIVID